MQVESNDIRRGLAAQEFFPAFQPLIELRTGELAGFEVLARWAPDGGESIPASAFIPAAESSGLINELTAEMLKKAFASREILQRPIMLALNISATQLLDPKLPVRLEAAAAESGFPLNRITIEITESALVDDLARAASVAHSLKDLGCRLSLDDFGTGYSSLTHLHTMPFDELKVDRSFVSSIALRAESREIVASVIGLGQGLGLRTVAEGVENQEQAEILFWMGCDVAQGWLFGKPLPADQISSFFSQPIWKSPAAAPGAADEQLLTSVQALPAHRLAQLQAIYDGAPVGLCFLDRHLRYISLNQRLAEMNGVPAAAHLGRRVCEVIPEVFPKIEPFIRRALAGESVTGVEVTKPSSDPNRAGQSVMLSYRSVRDGAGNTVGVSVAVMDVTQSKLTEEALRESEEHFRHMMNLSPHVPWVLDEHGQVSEASPRWEQYTGQPIAEALGDGWLRVLHPDDVPPTRDAIQRSLASGVPIDIQYRVRTPQGAWQAMRSRGSPRFSMTGKPICIYGVVEAVNANGQRTEEANRCEVELRTALEAVPVAIILADGNDGAIYMANPRAVAIFQGGVFPGQKFTEYERMGLLQLNGSPVSSEDHPLTRSIQRGEVVEAKPCLLRSPDGKFSRISVSSRPIVSDQHRLIGGMMIVRAGTGTIL